jgi:hypothetical protein
MTASIFASDKALRSQLASKKSSVCKEVAARQTVDQRRRAAQVVSLATQKPEVDQGAQSIRQGHDLAGHAAARASDSLA